MSKWLIHVIYFGPEATFKCVHPFIKRNISFTVLFTFLKMKTTVIFPYLKVADHSGRSV
jgi:hypothetical protein